MAHQSHRIAQGVGRSLYDHDSAARFRDALGVLNARLAAAADEVWLVTAGIAQRLR